MTDCEKILFRDLQARSATRERGGPKLARSAKRGAPSGMMGAGYGECSIGCLSAQVSERGFNFPKHIGVVVLGFLHLYVLIIQKLFVLVYDVCPKLNRFSVDLDISKLSAT